MLRFHVNGSFNRAQRIANILPLDTATGILKLGTVRHVYVPHDRAVHATHVEYLYRAGEAVLEDFTASTVQS